MASLVHSSALSCSRATAALAPLPSRGDCRALNNGGLRTDLGLCRHKSNLPLLRRTRCDAFGNVRAQAMSVGVETKIASKADVGEVSGDGLWHCLGCNVLIPLRLLVSWLYSSFFCDEFISH